MTQAAREQQIVLHRSGPDFRPFGASLEGVPLFYTTPSMALIEAPTRWMFYLALDQGRTASPKTWMTYAESLLDWLRTCHENEWDPLGVIQGHLGAYRSAMLHQKSIRGSSYSLETINIRLNVVQRFYEWMVVEGIITTYPFQFDEAKANLRDSGVLGFARGARRQHRRANNIRRLRSIPAAIPVEGLKSIMNALAERDRLIVKWAIATGARKGELLALDCTQIPDISTLRGFSQIKLRITKTKGRKPRSLRVPVRLIDDTQRYINGERALAIRNSARRGISAEKALFVAVTGVRLASSTISKNFSQQAKKICPTPRFHDLRHTYAIHRLRELRRGLSVHIGAEYEPLRVLQAELGHNDLSATQIYLRSIEEDASIVENQLVSLLDEVDD